MMANDDLCSFKSQMQLHFFVFDDRYSGLQGQGSAVDLRAWYGPEHTIKHLVFHCGMSEELAVIDNVARARVFSLAAQQFR